ncbi:MAG TPA: helix-turn-helix domain-containing protein [Solirubrobacterales bacterium]|nr:helix-turn-helix domain-containing protein [Solirubrobacterales bacterium]
MPIHACRLAPRDGTHHLDIGRGLDRLIDIDKFMIMEKGRHSHMDPRGRLISDAADDRARRSEAYREARDEYAAIRELRERNWIAAHIRERRYELDLTQKEVAEQAGTSHSFVSKVEGGDHIPTIPVLKRILAVLDEELLIGIERQVPDEEPEREIAPAPELAAA